MEIKTEEIIIKENIIRIELTEPEGKELFNALERVLLPNKSNNPEILGRLYDAIGGHYE